MLLGYRHLIHVVQVPPRTLGQIPANWVSKPADIYLIGRDWVGHGQDIAPSLSYRGPNLPAARCVRRGLGPLVRKPRTWVEVTAIGPRAKRHHEDAGYLNSPRNGHGCDAG